MRSLAGTTVLIVDGDYNYSQELSQSLTSIGAHCLTAEGVSEGKDKLQAFDIEFIISSYYLPDGLIHQLIDWSKSNLDSLPGFIALGSRSAAEKGMLRQHLILDVWNKNDFNLIGKTVAQHAVDKIELKKALLELVEPKGFFIELLFETENYSVKPIEVYSDGIVVSGENHFHEEHLAYLKISLHIDDSFKVFKILGNLRKENCEDYFFQIHSSYSRTWNSVLSLLESKQIQILKFLKKASGY